MTNATKNIDSKLLIAMEEQGPVAAVVYIKPPDDLMYASTEEVGLVTQTLLERVEAVVNEKPLDVNIFKNLSSFFISTSPVFMRELLKQPEVGGAVNNKQ
jgi:hypothetical protein